MQTLRPIAATMPLALLLLASGCTTAERATGVAEPDLGEVLHLSNRDGDYEIYLHDLTGGTSTKLTDNDITDYGLAWSPDGSTIAFGRWIDGRRDIYTMNADGSGVNRLTDHEAHDTAPCWSPDGSRIVFVSRRDSDRGEIYTMNADGSGITRLTTNDRYEEVPAWSPDGNLIAFGALAGDTKDDAYLQIFVLDLRTGKERQITQLPGHNSAPRWSPDARRIAFYGNVGAGFAGADIFVVSPDGSGMINLTNDPEPDWQPDWSPDGSHIVWARGPGDPLDLWIMRADGSERRPIVEAQGRDEQPHWRPVPSID